MTALALGLVLTSAILHAIWNLLAKRVGGGAPFTWLFALLTFLLLTPAALVFVLWQRPQVSAVGALFIAGSAVLHLGYFISLQRGYRAGDLSLVYPLARGSGPLLATVGAVSFLGERPSILALAGTALIVVSVFMLSGGGGWSPHQRKAALYGLLTGVFIASYTLWDGYAVTRVGVNPLLFSWASEGVRAVLLTPLALLRWREIETHWREHRLEAFGVAALSPLAYILVLIAFTFTPISYVAPAREISILFGALLGARVLSEGQAGLRQLAAGAMVLGVALLALG